MVSAQKIIKDVLHDVENSEWSINSDAELYKTVCLIYLAENFDLCLYEFSVQGFFKLLEEGKLPSFETVRRARQKSQVKFKEVVAPVEEPVVEPEVEEPIRTIVL